MGKFQEKVKAHMEKYNGQKNELEGKKGGTWQGKGSYKHILRDSQNDWKFNLLSPYRDKGPLVRDIEKGLIKKHMYAHHLDSSQMMCMNFFYPLMCKNKLSCILNVINPDEQWGDIQFATFEKISDIDGKQRGATNFDFYIETKKGNKIYFEIKYTENEFGKAKADQSHIEKWEKMYKALIYDSPILKSNLIDQQYFFKNYQIIRNAIHVQDTIKDYSIFIVPEYKKPKGSLYYKAQEIIEDIVKNESKGHVKVLSWDNMINAVENDPQLKKYYAEFKKKYLDLN